MAVSQPGKQDFLCWSTYVPTEPSVTFIFPGAEAYEPPYEFEHHALTYVTEVSGMIDGVKIVLFSREI